MPDTRSAAIRRIATLAAALCFAGAALAGDDAAPAGRALIDALRTGGLVVYFRHAATDFGENDIGMTDYADCRNRNLTDAGRADARLIGSAIQRLGLPIGDVLASPVCRTMETAALIFGRAVATPAVLGGPAAAGPEKYAGLVPLLSTWPPAGVDLVVVGHANPFRAGSDIPLLAEGEAAVLRPLGTQGFHLVARIPKDGWDALAAP
jgi:phosphohistidine phosphatase SixA